MPTDTEKVDPANYVNVYSKDGIQLVINKTTRKILTPLYDDSDEMSDGEDDSE